MSLTDIYAVMPTAILGLGSVVLLLTGAFAPSAAGRALNLAGAGVAFASAVVAVFYSPQVPEVGGIIGTGGFGRLFSAVSGLTAFFTLLLSVGYTGRRPLGREEYPSLVLFAAFGMDILGSSTGLLGVFLGLECMSLALYVLLASNRDDPRSGEAGLKYLVIGAVSTAFLAFGLALMYTASGSLAIKGAMSALSGPDKFAPIGMAGFGLFLVGIGFKASLFPFHLWAPDVYEGGPAPVVAFLSTGSKAAVFAALLGFALSSGEAWRTVEPVLWVMAAATMAFGNLAALTQNNIKRLLAYSSIAQMGYILMAMLSAPSVGATAAVFYLVVYVAMDLGAFGVVAGFSTRDRELGGIETLRGLGFVHPFRSAVLALCLLSLAGLPPTAGFIGKFWVFYAAIKAGYVYLAVFGILTAIVAVYYYLRVIVALYMSPGGADAVIPRFDPEGRLALALLAAALIYLGVFPSGLIDTISGITSLGGM